MSGSGEPPGEMSGSSSGGSVGDQLVGRVEVCNKKGLHARAAAKFTKLAEQFDCAVEIARGDTVVDGRSIMGLMYLGAGPGSSLEVRVAGREAVLALEALCALVAAGFYEDQDDPPQG